MIVPTPMPSIRGTDLSRSWFWVSVHRGRTGVVKWSNLYHDGPRGRDGDLTTPQLLIS